jgi:hypothetical protein
MKSAHAFTRQSLDFIGAQRDSGITRAEDDLRVMAVGLGKLSNFLNKVERFLEIVESSGPPLAIDCLLVRPEARLPHLPD